MLNAEFTLNVFNLILMIAGAVAVGYYTRSRQLKKKQFKISELRKEIVYNHAQILELQKEYVSLEKSVSGSVTPVRPISGMLTELKETAAL